MALTENSRKILERRYLAKNEKRELIETPEKMFRRVAQNIASAETLYGGSVEKVEHEFYDLMTSFKFLPNSPTLMNAGRDLQQLSACFVLPIDDSIESIFDAVKYTALIHKSGGGTGFSFSRLRPKNDVVQTTGGIASGPISFMKVLNTSTEVIKQGGRRRGANMGILRVDHPDIIEFITSKKDLTELTNFNISVAVTAKFMDAVKTGQKYELVNPRTNQVVEKLDAKNVFDLIVEMAWTNGEPGLFFIDRANQFNPTPALGNYESTNPCGEQLLLPMESCNLGSINLAKMAKQENGQYTIDYEELKRIVRFAVRFLDNVIDMNNFPLPEIEKMTKENRKIGLGVMGWADLLIQLKVPYDSQEALELAEKIMKFLSKEGRKASEDLAKERIPFPSFGNSIYKDSTPLRNATITTIAPTGTISMIADCSSGIEPLFAVSYFKKVMDGEKLVTVNKYFERIAKEEGIYSQELMQKIAEQGTIQNIDEIPEHIRRIFVTAHDISPEWHVRMQAAFQKYTDNAVSKTVNMPQDATKADVATVFMTAYELGCKGVTVFRYGSREAVVNIGKVEAQEAPPKAKGVLAPRTRPSVTVGETERIRTGCGNLYVTINADSEGLFEVFSTLGHSGGCPSAQSEAISRLISLSLRSGVKIESIIKQLREIRCPSPSWDEGALILSCPDAIGKALSRYIERQGMENSDEKPAMKSYFGICPECGGQLVHEEGCLICKSCGASKCE
ncbi:MAG: vitamin B12-dependent ribonucleotide reductase [Promethearchaeota archaeon]